MKNCFFNTENFKSFPVWVYGLVTLLFLLTFFSCATYRLKKNLSPENKEFLSKVRYIITKQEKKTFLHLPPSEREKFRKEFWNKRDPEAETEENEFKEKYFNRIEEANHLFVEGGTPGWLQDRGRVYILLGPPSRRDIYPRGYTFYGKPMEIWYYGFFPIVFIDNNWSGDYKLSPQSAYQIAQMNATQMQLKPQVNKEDVVFDFKIEVEKTDKNKALIQIEVPYKNIWFKEKNDRLKTTLKLEAIVSKPSGDKVWEYKENYDVSIDQENIEKMMKQSYFIEIPVKLKQGKYSLVVELENKTDKSRIRKKGKLLI